MTSTPNPRTKSQVDVAFNASPVLHPDYQYWSPMWRMIRDAEIGEVEIKRKGQTYLPKLQGHDQDQYNSYLHRAVFFNMTSKTLNALYGTMFRRNPKVSGLSANLTKITKNFSKDGMSLHLTAKTAAKEVLAVGRYGMLVDAAPDGAGNAYAACYTAENILDWHMEEINGTWAYTRVVLREISYKRDSHFSPYDYTSRFRVLVLHELPDGGHVYEQHIYEDRDMRGIPDFKGMPDGIVIPTVRGEPLGYIPFAIVGPFTNHPDVQKPPILDIVTLNFSHYGSYAQLEQGRFYTANPVYYTSSGTADDGEGEYYVGPDVVWELGKDGKAGVIEFQGHGLKFLESALDMKESQIAALGGRMMPGLSRGAAESDNSLKMKEQNEQTLLLNISDTMDEAFTQIIKWWADWNNAPGSVVDKIVFETNRDFLLKDIGAREFRAIHQMYADGVIPLDVVYEYLRKAEVIPEWMDDVEYKKLLNDSKQFPHMVDVLARMNDYPDAKSFLEYKMQKEEWAHAAQEVKPSPNDPSAPPVPKQAMDARAVDKKREAAQ
ncbi:putative portal protein [Ruegeria phage vB_RpoS-V10]|nr:putative portal protein [Roseobacter phage DSS3P8]AWY09148.1 putative portal protein [Ruegeria phage vB_RpoS-V10]